MIDVTVKTLDSQNHRYSVPDDITVQQFKDRIASSVSIPSDKQRLIYCGRVLQDDKNLSDYNVHEKVIHLVMRAPPQASGRGNDSGTSNNDSGQIPSRGSHRSARAQGRHVLFGSIVVPEDAIDDLTSTTTRGPSSSGVRLQQAKTMLDRASDVIEHLEEVFATYSSRPSTSSTPSSDESPHTESSDGPVGATGISEESSTSNGDSSSKKSSAEKKKHFDCSSRLQPPTSIPAEELESLYMEMDALNNTYNSMEPSLMGGTQVIPQMGSPFVGAISTSLAGGLAHAASAAFASAFSSMNSGSSTPSSSAPSSSAPTGTTSSSSASSTTTANSASQSSGTNSSGNSTSPSTSSFESFLNSVRSAYSSSSPPTTSNTSTTTSSSAASAPPNSSAPSAGSHSVRGITVRITNRTQRPTGIRLEHPRCTVMVEVLDQYQDIQQRLQPFLSQYYRTLANDQTYENINDRQLQADQYILWRVSAAMHFISHAMHAISDIIIDLRRNPPRQLRARPIIIPQPAIVQAQINVAHNPDASQSPRNTTRSTPRASRPSNTSGSTTPGLGSAGPGVPNAANASDSSPSAESVNSHRNIMELDDGVVVMHVGPNGFTIDSISAENNNDELNGNPPPELLQNLMSTLTSQLGMNLGNVSVSATPNAPPTTSNSSQSAPGAGRTAAPGHNSQATGNSGTNTTNATQTRVTPRPHVHVTPLHVPGMGMTQFDPFLPCQSHHIRPSAARPRWRHVTTNQTQTSVPTESNENQQSTNSTQTTSSVSSQEPSTSTSRPQNTVVEHFLSSVLGNVFSTSVNDGLSEEQLNQENMLAELIRGVSAELCGTLGSQRREPESGGQSQAATLHEFLIPFSGGGFFTELESENFFAQLFTIISQSISLGDLVQIFFGDSQRLNQLRIPLRTFIQERLEGAEPTDVNINRTIDGIILTLDPYLVAATGGATVNDGIDFLHTIHNFIRQRICDVIRLIFNTQEASTFGPALFTLLQRSFRELIAICVHCFSDGVQGLERLVEARVQAVMSGMRPSIQTWSVTTSLVQLRSMLSQLTITDDQIRHFIVTPDESPRTSELSQSDETAEVANKSSKEENKEKHNEKDIEAMEVDDLGGVEEVTTTPENGIEGAMAADDPISVTIGSQPWHSAVPQDWIPVLTRDVERQRRGVPDTNLSDAYLYGMPLKRRKICSQKKPHGTVEQVVQDTLRQALRTSGVNRTLIESVSGEVSNQLTDSFANHVRSSLKEHLDNNQDFKPEKFPKSEQKIRRN